MPSKSLPSSPSLDHLKYQAKDLLKARQAQDPAAFQRLREFHPKFARLSADELKVATLSLQDAQLVVAREYGFESWPRLKQHVQSWPRHDATAATPSHPGAIESRDALAARFLEFACPDHHVRGGPAHAMARDAAARLLRRHPEIARHSLYTAVACGELDEVERILAQKPGAAAEKHSEIGPDRSGAGESEDLFRNNGPKRWEPLLYLCFARLPVLPAAENAARIARLLLDHGADPNAFFMAGDSRYTGLVGVIGEGEENRPPHPQRDALARLLLERGAQPYDMQVVYNIHFRGDILWFMKLMHEFSVKAGRQHDWSDPDWPMLDMGNYGNGARWHLEIAIKNNDLELAQWLLAHGANPNAAPARDRRFSQRTLHEEAMSRGSIDIARLLERHGARPAAGSPPGEDAFAAACFRLDQTEVRRLARENPAFLRQPAPLFEAARLDRADVAALLLDLGVSPDMVDRHGQGVLHIAAYNDAVRVAQLLLDRGARIDALDGIHGTTPLWWAIWGQRPGTIELLSGHSRDLKALSFIGRVDRLRDLLRADPNLAKSVSSHAAPLLWLPGEEDKALEIARLFLAHGADPAIRNQDGETAADLAAKRGLDEVARLLRGSPQPDGGAVGRP